VLGNGARDDELLHAETIVLFCDCLREVESSGLCNRSKQREKKKNMKNIEGKR
jgi:hypothetical protein